MAKKAGPAGWRRVRPDCLPAETCRRTGRSRGSVRSDARWHCRASRPRRPRVQAPPRFRRDHCGTRHRPAPRLPECSCPGRHESVGSKSNGRAVAVLAAPDRSTDRRSKPSSAPELLEMGRPIARALHANPGNTAFLSVKLAYALRPERDDISVQPRREGRHERSAHARPSTHWNFCAKSKQYQSARLWWLVEPARSNLGTKGTGQ